MALIFFKMYSSPFTLYGHPFCLSICETKGHLKTSTCIEFYFHVYLERLSFNQVSVLCEMHMLSMKIKLVPFKVPQQLKFTIRCVMSWCSIESLLKRDINFKKDQHVRFQLMQQDAGQWGGWKGKVCVLSFTGKMFLPLRPLTLTD